MELKPCPFCGGRAVVTVIPSETKIVREKDKIPKDALSIEELVFRSRTAWKYRVPSYCPQCEDSSCLGRVRKHYSTEEIAIYAWNKRA